MQDKNDKSDKSDKDQQQQQQQQQFFADETKKKKNKKPEEKEKKIKQKHEKEAAALAQFKRRIQGLQLVKHHDDDAAFLRFLRARKYDIEKSFVLFDNCLKWRASYHPETVTLEMCPREKEAAKGFLIGRDRTGRPCFLLFPGRHDPKNADNQECVRALVYHIELAVSMMGPGVEQCVLVVDFDGWSMKNTDHDLDKMMIDTIQNCYPERLGAAYLLNAPTIFKMAWIVIKPWLDKRTTSKIRFVTNHETRDDLREDITLDTLPVRYGGRNNINLDPPKGIKTPPKGLKMDK